MKYEVYFAVACNTGKVRKTNQDNFYCSGDYLESINDALDSIKSDKISTESNPAFAVFDGMGGEQDGEIAAHIAAKTFDKLCRSIGPKDTNNFLLDSCKQINNNITDYAKQKYASCVGTTAAMLIFSKKEIYACNIGDSKIFCYDDKTLTQISKDHVIDIFKDRKAPLTQYLGIPESEFIIGPYIAQGLYKDGDYYLICSDGLTDMLSEDEIKNIISKNKDVKICVDILLEQALSKGGKDNITVILCNIKKKQNIFFKRLFKSNI